MAQVDNLITDHLLWETENWIGKVSQWVNDELGHHGMVVNGALDQFHIRPWSTVIRVPTNKGTCYFKALCPVLKYEPALIATLSRLQPDLITPLLAVDAERGWMLMPDGGPTLRMMIEKERNLDHWKNVLHKYAELQIAMISHIPELSSTGIHDRKLEWLPKLYTDLLNDRDSLLVDQTEGLSSLELERLNQLTGRFQALCKELAAFGIPETLVHDDFHDANIFYDQGNLKFFDWAESFISHPFFTMVVTMRAIAYQFGMDESSKELSGLRDLYLEHWQGYGNRSALNEAFGLAMSLGRVNRALTWHMVISSLPERVRGEDASAVPGWLQLFLERIPKSD